MKILHINYTMERGGAETMLVDILNEQSRRGHDVHLLVVNDREDAELMAGIAQSVTVHRFRRRQGSNPILLLLRLNAFVLRQKPDAIHLHGHKLPGLLKVMRSKVLLTVHDINTPMRYARGTNMVAISKAVADYIVSVIPTAKPTVIHNGILTHTVRRREHHAGSTFHFVQAGRLVSEKKGQDISVAALAKIVDRGYDADITFFGSGNCEEQLRRQAEEAGVADRVHFAGALTRKEVYHRLADFDAMCHPSRYEGFGLVVAEGLAAGLPLIVTEHDGPWEVAGRGRYCRSIPCGDVDACAREMAWTIDNHTQALTTAEQGRRHVEENYSIARMVDQYINYYQTLQG